MSLRPDLPAEALQAYAHTANFYYTHAYRNGINFDRSKDMHQEQDEKDFKKLAWFILDGNFAALQDSEEIKTKTFYINYRNRRDKETLLHYAYLSNQPKIVEFLIQEGADERIPDFNGRVPLARAHDDYVHTTDTVIKEIVSRYFKNVPEASKDPHLVFDTILNFIHEKKWKYQDTEGFNLSIPFRDETKLVCFGLPSLAYHVNCSDLTTLFIQATKQIGLNAEKVTYYHYKSVKRTEKEKFNIKGEMAMFDGSRSDKDNFEFFLHYVAFCAGWHFDLTLMCKYQDMAAILAKS